MTTGCAQSCVARRNVWTFAEQRSARIRPGAAFLAAVAVMAALFIMTDDFREIDAAIRSFGEAFAAGDYRGEVDAAPG
jgi:hypothetical protein